MWGLEPTNIYSVSSARLWKFNGESWNRISEQDYSQAIFGFSNENIWTSGNDGKIFHFDGSQWKLSFQYFDVDKMITSHINDFYGKSWNDLYAVGTYGSEIDSMYYGFILHYDGRKWEEEYVSRSNEQFQIVQSGIQGIFIRGVKYYAFSRDTVMLYKYRNGGVEEAIVMPEERISDHLWVNAINNEILVLERNKLKVYPSNTLIEFPDSYTVYGFFGRSRKDLFLNTSEGIKHYNGEDIVTLFDGKLYNNYLILENDVFFCVYDYSKQKYLFYHGSIKNKVPL